MLYKSTYKHDYKLFIMSTHDNNVDNENFLSKRNFILLGSNSKKWVLKLFSFIGPGFIIAVGYSDPGNWSTDLSGGSQFGYSLLFVIFISNLIAILLQSLAIRLGVISGLDLAQACRCYFPKSVSITLYILAEIAIIFTDLAELIGTAIGLELLFNIPLIYGVIITCFDVVILMLVFKTTQNSVNSLPQHDYVNNLEKPVKISIGSRILEIGILLLVIIVGICFALEINFVKPNGLDVLKGFVPTINLFTDPNMIFVAMGIIGATVMPHNLFLGSAMVKSRSGFFGDSLNQQLRPRFNCSKNIKVFLSRLFKKNFSNDTRNNNINGEITENEKDNLQKTGRTTSRIFSIIKFSNWDLIVALFFALFVNSAILVVSAAAFYYGIPIYDSTTGEIISRTPKIEVAEIKDAHAILLEYLGSTASTLFALALFCAGQSSSITATLAGQIVMEGFIGWNIKPWKRRIATRIIVLVPTIAIIYFYGNSGLSRLLVFSQVALSVQLPFTVIPLVWFVFSDSIMRVPVISESNQEPKFVSFKPSVFIGIIAFLCTLVLVFLNIFLIFSVIKNLE